MTKQQAHKVVKKLGFEVRRGKENFYTFYHGGRLILTTAVPKGKGELRVANDFRQQLKITRSQLAMAIKCPFGLQQYVDHLETQGHLG